MSSTPDPVSRPLVAATAASCFLGWWLHDVTIMVHGGWLPYLSRTLFTSALLLVVWAGAATLASRSTMILRVLAVLGIVLSTTPKIITALGLPLPVSTVTASVPKTLTALGLALMVAFLLIARRNPQPKRILLAGAGAGGAAAGLLFLVRSRADFSIPANLPSILAVAAGTLTLFAMQRTKSSWLAGLAVCSGSIVLISSVVEGREHYRLPRPDRVAISLPSSPKTLLPSAAPNLVLITLDTVTAHHLKTHDYSRSTMPFLEEFVGNKTTNYRNARSSAPWTLPSHATLLSGLSPAEHGATSVSTLDPRQPSPTLRKMHPLQRNVETLAEILTAAGYRSGAVVANAPVLHPALGIDRGFERYDGRVPTPLPVPQGLLFHLLGHFAAIGSKPYYDASLITRRSLRWLDSPDQKPFFLFVNYLDAHVPLIPEDGVRDAFDNSQPKNQVHAKRELWPLLYDRELLSLDHHLATLLRELERRQDFDNTVIVITSDHGESFGAHDFWGHAIVLYEEVLHVPLFVKPTGPAAPSVVDQQVDGVAVQPLILSLLGIPRASSEERRPTAESYRSYVQTRNPLPQLEPADRLTWLENGVKAIVNSNGLVEIFDLSSDPREQTNLVTQQLRQHYLDRARAWWKQHPRPQTTPPTDLVPDPDAEKRLRALGYLGGQ